MEIWLPVVGYAGLYEVSDAGRVRSLRTNANHPKSHPRDPGGMLSKCSVSDGYLVVTLFNGAGQRRMRRVNRLVLEAFRGPCPKGHVGGHLNAIRNDNRLTNLAWLTHAENSAQREADGNTAKGESVGSARLKADQVRQIRAMRGTTRQADLAEKFGVSKASISFIQTRRTWKSVE